MHVHTQSNQTEESYKASCENMPSWAENDVLNPKGGLGFGDTLTFSCFDRPGTGTFKDTKGNTYYIEDMCCRS